MIFDRYPNARYIIAILFIMLFPINIATILATIIIVIIMTLISLLTNSNNYEARILLFYLTSISLFIAGGIASGIFMKKYFKLPKDYFYRFFPHLIIILFTVFWLILTKYIPLDIALLISLPTSFPLFSPAVYFIFGESGYGESSIYLPLVSYVLFSISFFISNRIYKNQVKEVSP